MVRRCLGLLVTVAALSAVGTSSAWADDLTVYPTQDPPHAYLGQYYSTSFWAGPVYDPPITWTFESGTLPDGLTFYAPNGSIFGTPTQALQSTQFTIRATDTSGRTGTRTYTLSVDLVNTGPTVGLIQQNVNGLGGFAVRTLEQAPRCISVILSGQFPRPC